MTLNENLKTLVHSDLLELSEHFIVCHESTRGLGGLYA